MVPVNTWSMMRMHHTGKLPLVVFRQGVSASCSASPVFLQDALAGMYFFMWFFDGKLPTLRAVLSYRSTARCYCMCAMRCTNQTWILFLIDVAMLGTLSVSPGVELSSDLIKRAWQMQCRCVFRWWGDISSVERASLILRFTFTQPACYLWCEVGQYAICTGTFECY